MISVKWITICATIFIVGQAAAQGPGVSTVRSRLQFLVGNYTTATSMPTGASAPKGATGKGTSSITWALDSMFLVIDEQSVNTLFGKYEGHGVLGYDAPTHQYVLAMFNNFGDHPSYKGDFVGDTLVLSTRVPMPTKPFDQKLQWYKDGNAVKMRVLNDQGQGFKLVLEQTALPVSSVVK